MKYLLNTNRPGTAAHIADIGLHGEVDTYCKMYSTGGMSKRYKKHVKITEDVGDKRICQLCTNVYYRFNPVKDVQEDFCI